MAVYLLLNRCLKKARSFYSHHLIRKYLRYIRDNVLSKTTEGQELINLYYELSPAIVNAIEEDEEFKKQVKEMVGGILELLE